MRSYLMPALSLGAESIGPVNRVLEFDSRWAQHHCLEVYVAFRSERGLPRPPPGREGGPTWSPDGRRIAFVRENGAYVVSADGSQERRLTPLGAHGLSWSPDGRRILFTHPTDRGAVGRGNRSEVYVVNADGSGQRRLTTIRRSYLASPAWSPDGRRIVYGHNWQLWVMNADGSGQRQLTLKGAHNFNPAWSPDGRSIAFERGRRQSSSNHVGTPGREIHVMNADGSGQKLLTRGGSQPRWSPDGQKIAYVSDRAGSLDIWVMNPDGGGQRNLTRSTIVARASPSGRRPRSSR
jgi:Tol biopolymer transport system component